MSDDLIKGLINLSEIKLSLVREILEITKKQSKCINENDIKGLQECIDMKQKRIDEINKIDSVFIEKYEEFKAINKIDSIEMIDIKKYPRLKHLKETINNILLILKEVQAIETDNNTKIKNEFDSLKLKLKNIKQGKKMVKGYDNAYKIRNVNSSIFINIKK
ncbi:flagellar protein FlgN [Caloranaerobacter azorensis]|uniref:flagellar protein FlgN n=1 Tax=Caloranaerobacter azorensis TaxID=116090 RepID=UPI000691ACD6|nr:flagellar protein FlgN [Caloranaerobacter azorensis]